MCSPEIYSYFSGNFPKVSPKISHQYKSSMYICLRLHFLSAFIAPLVSSSALIVTNSNTKNIVFVINCANGRCMHGLIEIHTGSKIIGNIYY